MTWTCDKCNGKNNNSSVKCRIKKCHAPKPEIIIKKEIIKQQKKELRDLCPNCHVHRDFIHIKKNEWKCPVCKRHCKFKGKPVPEYTDDGKSDIL